MGHPGGLIGSRGGHPPLEGEGDAAGRQPRYTEAMTERATEIMQKALSLSEEERADLACSLMDSLDATVDDDAESAWEQEIARRIADLDSGRAKTVSWEEVRGRISSKLPHGKQGS